MKTINEYRINYESLDEKRVIADTMESALRLALKENEDEPKSITCMQKKIAYATAADPVSITPEALTEQGETVLFVSVVPEHLTDVQRGDTVYFQYIIPEEVTLFIFDHWEVNGKSAGTDATLRVEIDDETEAYKVSAVFKDLRADVDAPTGVECTAKTDSSLLFTWEGELPEDGYFEYTLKVADTGDVIVNAEHTTLNSVEFEQLYADEAYQFSVCAKDKVGNASDVVVVYAATLKETPLPVINLQAENVTTDSADLTFEAPTGTYTGYLYSLDDGTTWTAASASPITLSGLDEDTEYTAIVVTVNDTVKSNARSVTFTTLAS